jgi:hypothetical protein
MTDVAYTQSLVDVEHWGHSDRLVIELGYSAVVGNLI